MSEPVKAIKSSAEFNLPFNGVIYSRIVDLSIYLSTIESKEELQKSMERINKNDPTLNPNDHAYHLHTILALMKLIDMEAEKQNVIETMSFEDFQQQARDRQNKS
jgi:hypothetical protein